MGRMAGAATGIAAAAVALAVAELVAVATGPQSSPLVAVGGVVVDNSPESVTRWAIDVFGTYDKLVLLLGTLVLLAAFAAALGILAERRLWIGLAGLGLFAAIGITAALSRHDAPITAALPTLLGALAGGTAFVLIDARHRASIMGFLDGRGGDTPKGEGPGRREVLRVAGLTLGGAAVVGFASRWIATRRGVSEARAAVDLPVPVDTAPPVPAAADLRVDGLASYVTSNADFYRIDTALVVPQVDPESWELRIHGRVSNPYTITFAELLARPMIERYVTLACVSNQVGGDLIGNARWLGVPVKELIEAAGPQPGADQVVSRSVDGWTCGTPTAVLTDGRDALLAVGMNGEPLPTEHGFPVRMVVPGLYGYVSACKWITEIELSSFDDYDAYWIPRGWAQQAPIKTQSRIDTPRRQADAGTVMVAGVAWAQHRGIERVEVQVDGGDWQLARLADTVSADTWRQWSWQWEAASGEHQLAVRATDSTGETQPAEPAPPAPDGATGWHTIQVSVR
jgi:DMSO/TMAO reductase YedYZ molybdopterin-dependent catalytic subunit